jgi:hypothetical protein
VGTTTSGAFVFFFLEKLHLFPLKYYLICNVIPSFKHLQFTLPIYQALSFSLLLLKISVNLDK